MKIVGLDHIQIAMPKGREQEARDFYQNILGIPEVQKPIALAKRGGAWFQHGSVKIHLGVEEDFRPAQKAHPALVVSDLDQLIVALNGKGFTVTEDDSISDVKRAFSNDPFGNRIEFIQATSSEVISSQKTTHFNSPMNPVLLPNIRLAGEDEKQVVRNIDQYYLYEFARLMPDRYSLGEDGIFHDDDYERYWGMPGHFPYLLFNGSELAGFALLQKNELEINLDQFFVISKHQGSGLAEKLAGLLFDAHRGRWKVQSFLGNEKSERFWFRVIAHYSQNHFTLSLQEPRRTHHEYVFSND